MKKILFFALAFSVVCSAAFASVGVKNSGSSVGQATDLDCVNGVTCTSDGGTVSVSGAAAAITSGTATGMTSVSSETVTGTTSVTGALVVGTQYVQLPYFSKVTRPASGATAGSVIAMGGANSNDCGTAGAGTTYNVCVSDGTNWLRV